MRTALFALFHAAFLGVTVLVVPASGQVTAATGTISEVPLPGGLRGALAVIGDRANPDRAQFLAEFIRRMYDTPFGVKADSRDPILEALVAQLKSGREPAETIPLPLSTKFWIDVVFRKQATPDTLVSSIIRSRSAALLYTGLLSLDDESRAWIAEQSGLISEILSRRAASFLIVSSGLRIKGGVVQVPGGAAAEPVWQALVGRRPAEATDFVRSLISADEGRLAFFFGTISQLNAPQLRYAFSLDAPDNGRRVDAARHLYSVFDRLWAGRALEQRVFVRPSFDPALLLAELNPSGDGAVTLPGTRGLWTAVFNEVRQTTKAARQEVPATITWDQPPDFPWLCEQIFKGDVPEHRRHFMMVLFASRYAAAITKDTARDAVEAIRAAAAFPALSATLERAGITDLAVFAAATRRATALSAIQDESRAYRALAQYQGALAMITGAATRGSIGADTATKLVASLSAIPLSERGDYEGRVVVWLGNWLAPGADSARKPRASGPAADGSVEEIYESAGGPIEEDALRVLSGPQAATPRTLDWEGTRYRLDFPRAEAVRVTRAQGDSSRPYLSSARTVLSIAEALAAGGLTRQALQQHAQEFARLSHADTPEESELSAGDMLLAYRDTANSLQRIARTGDVNAAAKLAPALRTVADDLLARGLVEWTYAAALGPLDGLSPTAAEAAARHDFGLRPAGGIRAAAWQMATEGSDPLQRWRVFGSLLGMDVTLARFSLVRLSMKPPAVRPTLGEMDRRVFIDAVALVEPKSLSDSDRDIIATAMRNGRARLKGVIQSPGDVAAIADIVSLSPQRRTLLDWTIAHDPSRVDAFLSPAELFWLGVGDARVADLDAWGVPATSRTGCLCLRVVRARSWEMFTGRWNTGMVASAFPDLNFRLAELLNELHMPAALLAPVLTSATLDFVNSATSRDQDDRRGLVEFVQALQADRLEQYLALLTTDGPLVPMGDAPIGKDFTHIETTMDVAGKKR